MSTTYGKNECKKTTADRKILVLSKYSQLWEAELVYLQRNVVFSYKQFTQVSGLSGTHTNPEGKI